MVKSDISHRLELSNGDVVWIQKVGRKYVATRLPPGWLATPEHSPMGTKKQALAYIEDWLCQDVCEMCDCDW